VPHFLPTATVEPDIFAGEGLVQGLLVHETQHEYLAGINVLDYSGDEPLFIEFDIYLPHPLSCSF